MPSENLADRLEDNVARVHNLISIYQALSGTRPGRRSVGDTDILRSAVVLLHASLEDFLRSLARAYLPTASRDVISSIPLKRSGTSSSRADRFSLGELVEHRGKTVDQLIDESVESHLERSNYNNCTEIVGLMEKVGLEAKPVERFFPDLDRMMQRRHQIVHRADCSSASGRGRHRAVSISQKTVEHWTRIVTEFHQAILYQIQQQEARNA